MLNTKRIITLFLATFLLTIGGITNLNASTKSIGETPDFSLSIDREHLAKPIKYFSSLIPASFSDFAKMQSDGGGDKSGGSGPKVTSDVDFLGMDYSTAITVLSIILVLLVVTVLILIQVSGQVSKFEKKQEEPGVEPESGIKKFFKGIANLTRPVWEFIVYQLNPVVGVLTVIGLVVVILMFGFYNRAQDLGTQVGYAPDQPVNFSHELHAGQYNIDCQYCHTGVRKSKSANIPSTNICMNCHNVVKEGPKYGSKEIEKVVESYNNNDPIEWVRIHNLPDHVYFNHSQHVKVGNVECESCHGDVANMEVVHQHSRLEMGWCIDCHRNRNVDTDNGYYQETYDFVDSHSKFTVADMGGTECQKCHY